LLLLLGDQFFRRIRWRGRWQQLQFEFGDGQEQRLGGGDLGVFHVTCALGDDLRQQVTAFTGFNRWIYRDCHGLGERAGRVAELFGQRLGEEVLPHMTDPGQRLGIAQAEVVVGRQYTGK